MTIKEGMYVRSKDGKIYQILDEEIDIRYRFDAGINTPFYKNGEYDNQIIKASYNIIDLIEVGDYVNGYKVAIVNNNLNEHKGECNCIDTELWFVNENNEFEELVIFENDIKSIVTKQQFESMKYRIGD